MNKLIIKQTKHTTRFGLVSYEVLEDGRRIAVLDRTARSTTLHYGGAQYDFPEPRHFEMGSDSYLPGFRTIRGRHRLTRSIVRDAKTQGYWHSGAVRALDRRGPNPTALYTKIVLRGATYLVLRSGFQGESSYYFCILNADTQNMVATIQRPTVMGDEQNICIYLAATAYIELALLAFAICIARQIHITPLGEICDPSAEMYVSSLPQERRLLDRAIISRPSNIRE